MGRQRYTVQAKGVEKDWVFVHFFKEYDITFLNSPQVGNWWLKKQRFMYPTLPPTPLNGKRLSNCLEKERKKKMKIPGAERFKNINKKSDFLQRGPELNFYQ